MDSFNDLLQGATKTVGEWADEIASSGTFRNIVPTKEMFAKELNQGIASNSKIKIQYLQKDIDEELSRRVNQLAKKSGISDDSVQSISEQITKTLHGTDYSDEAFQKLAEIMKKNNIDDNTFEKFTNIASKSVQNILQTNVDIAPSLKGTANPANAKAYIKTYFNNPDPKIRQQRIAAVAGTYGAVAIGGRYLSGGTVTRDNYGRKDIAGVPFI